MLFYPFLSLFFQKNTMKTAAPQEDGEENSEE
jgi:hypothetical protein